MATRKRVIYQSEALFVGPSGGGVAGSHPQINRVQSANYSFEIARTDINEFGKLARIDSIIVEQPTVSLDFSYFQTDGVNEANLGLNVSASNATATSALANLLDGTQDVKNYYVYVSAEGKDAQGFTGTPQCIGIGNGFLSSYSVEASVGDIPTTTINVEGLNMRFYNSVTSQPIPAVHPHDGSASADVFSLNTPTSVGTISALRPGDVTLQLTGTNLIEGAVIDDLKIQSFTLSFDLSREPLQKLGSKFAFSREMEFPITATLAVEAVLGDIEAENLATLINNDGALFNGTITMKEPTGGLVALIYSIRGMKLDSQDFSSSIGENKTVSLSFSTQVSSSTDLTNGIFISLDV